MNSSLLKPYNPAETESRIYSNWEKSGFFNPDNLPEDREKPFAIIMPPPNANGSLHAGHSLVITLEDIIIRYQRMRGKRTLWIPGADHAGFETQVVYEKELEKQGRSRFGMDPKKLYDEIYDFTIKNKSVMENQVKQLGASCDWSRERFTLDPDIVKKVQETFIKMHKNGLVYRGKRTINWCPKHQTSLSEVETENIEEKNPFYYFKYGPFEIGTVRPETKFGDKYVVMHPKDKRYKNYKHGDKLNVEWINGPITATIVKDEAVDMDFGTGVMTITPWHSSIDFEIAKKHNLDFEQIIDWRGKLLPIAGEFVGLNIREARPKIVEKLRSKGLLTRIDETYKNVIKRCYKCNSMIEPQVKDQWFVKMDPLAKLALKSAEKGQITFIPDNYEKIFKYWMKNTIDWNISRQIVWGIPIPAWLCVDCDEQIIESNGIAPKCSKCHKSMLKDPDTFDTWFSSGQWPLLVLNFPDGKDFKMFYPTDVMETGHDLIFKWVPRMVIFGLYLTKQIPFKTVYLHGLVNDAKGEKMSKSKGNIISPTELTRKYGTDALRMGLVVGNTPGSDLALHEDKIKGYKHFANKIWNVTRFVLSNTDDSDFLFKAEYTREDDLNKKSLDELIEDVTSDMENYRLYLASEKIYHYFWHTFADLIIEDSKEKISSLDLIVQKSKKRLLAEVLTANLKLLHPFMPFVTEELWSFLPIQDKQLLIVENWPN